jgi:VanZ family protein
VHGLKRVSQWGPAVAYAGLIFYLSSQSSFPVPGRLWDFDKVIHFIEYGVFAVLLLRATRSPLISLLIAAAYGVSDELHQSFTPGRDCSAFDALADCIGAGLVCGVAVLRNRKLRG